MKSYTELEVWIKARKLASLCYEMTKSFPKEEIFGLTSQMRRSAVSIPSNIAKAVVETRQKIHCNFFS